MASVFVRNVIGVSRMVRIIMKSGKMMMNRIVHFKFRIYLKEVIHEDE